LNYLNHREKEHPYPIGGKKKEKKKEDKGNIEHLNKYRYSTASSAAYGGQATEAGHR
jgi:hypothetical protein